MTKDEIRTRIAGCRAALDRLESGTGESGEPEVGVETRKQHLQREITSLEALLEES